MDLRSFSVRHPSFDLQATRISPATVQVIPFTLHSSALDAVLILTGKGVSPKLDPISMCLDIVYGNTEATPKKLEDNVNEQKTTK